MTTLTVVVPTRDSGRTIAACLASVQAQSAPVARVIVVDGGSTDATLHIAAECADLVIRTEASPGGQRNRGWRAADSDVIAIVEPGLVLDRHALADAVAALVDGAGAVVLTERGFGRGFLGRCRAWARELHQGDERFDVARVFPATVLFAVGGFDEQQGDFVEHELTDRLRALDVRIGRTRTAAQRDEGELSLRGALRATGKDAARIRARPRHPDAIRPSWTARLRRVARAPHLAIGLILLALAQTVTVRRA